MAGVNKVILLGRLGKDPDLTYSKNSGKAVCRINLATSEKYNGEERTEWHNVVMFDRQAEVANEYLRKGSQVYIEGRIQTRKWQDQNGNDRYMTEIIGTSLQLIGGKSDQTAPPRNDQGGGQASGQTEPKKPKQDEFGDWNTRPGHIEEDFPF